MNQKLISCLVFAMGALLFTATSGFSFSSFGNAVNSACAPAAPYTGDCALCHTGAYSDPTPAKDAALAGGTTLTDFFCMPTGPTCTDTDSDTYSVEGGACGPVDCNDTLATINPGEVETCGDTIDNNCNGNIDERCRQTCPAGAQLVIKSIQWNKADHRKLTITGRSRVVGQSALGTTISITNTDTGEVLKDAVAVTGPLGYWKVTIRGVARGTLKRITITSSNGCTKIQRLAAVVWQQ